MRTETTRVWRQNFLFAIAGILLTLGMSAVMRTMAAGDVIAACVQTTNGTVRIVETAADCRENERAFQWNAEGREGPPGPPGPTGISDYEIVREVSASHTAGKSVSANCPVGKMAISGGAFIVSGGAHTALQSSMVDGEGSGWTVRAIPTQPTGIDWTLHVHAICATVGS